MNCKPDTIRAGFAYFAIVFALGFVLGTIRVFGGARALGETTFILLELPFMLLASFVTARFLARRYAIDTVIRAARMGLLAFALLMTAELALVGTMSPGDPVAAAQRWLASLGAPPGIFGFLGQIAFGLMPLAVVRPGRA